MVRQCLHRGTRGSDEGFTLIEIVLVLAVLGVLTSFAVPLADQYIAQSMWHDTRQEMMDIRVAVQAYYDDIGSFPGTLNDLEVQPAGVTGWQGPYITPLFADASANQDDYHFDAWHRPYSYVSTSTVTRELHSSGVNGIDESGSGDDIVLPMEITSSLRSQTRRALEVVNAAVQAYNRDNLPSNPLPTAYPDLLQTLQQQNYLPLAAAGILLETDAWGNPYVAVGDPVIEVVSQGSTVASGDDEDDDEDDDESGDDEDDDEDDDD